MLETSVLMHKRWIPKRTLIKNENMQTNTVFFASYLSLNTAEIFIFHGISHINALHNAGQIYTCYHKPSHLCVQHHQTNPDSQQQTFLKTNGLFDSRTCLAVWSVLQSHWTLIKSKVQCRLIWCNEIFEIENFKLNFKPRKPKLLNTHFSTEDQEKNHSKVKHPLQIFPFCSLCLFS